MNAVSLLYLWAGVKQNISLHQLEYSTSGAFYDLEVIAALIEELNINKAIEKEIRGLPDYTKQRLNHVLNLSNV